MLNVVDLGCRWLLVVVFALAALGKSRGRRSFTDFVQTLQGFGLPRGWAGAPLAATVIAAEELSAVLLLFVPWAGYAVALLLLGGFTVGLARVWRRGEAVSCRCFGASNTPVGLAHLVRNGLLLAVLGVGAFSHLARTGESSPLELSVLAGALGALAGFFVTRWDDLVFLLLDSQPAASASVATKKSRQ